MSFLPDNYTPPTTSGQYLKIWDGESIRIRILTSPVMFYQWWSNDNKPLRVAFESGMVVKTPDGANLEKKSQFVWAMCVYNYALDKVQIWSPYQKAFLNYITDCSKDEDFGNPKTYDFKIARKWQAMETEYTITALLKPDNMKELNKDILLEASQIDLKALVTNWNPFEGVTTHTPVNTPPVANKMESSVKIEDVPF